MTAEIRAIAHINLRIPLDGEVEAEKFWCGLLGLTVHPKPAGNSHPGLWFAANGFEIHVSPEEHFAPATKAHIAFIVDDLTPLATRLRDAGVEVAVARGSMDQLLSCFLADPFGNRLELMTLEAAENPD